MKISLRHSFQCPRYSPETDRYVIRGRGKPELVDSLLPDQTEDRFFEKPNLRIKNAITHQATRAEKAKNEAIRVKKTNRSIRRVIQALQSTFRS
jgi:hypothetical protein